MWFWRFISLQKHNNKKMIKTSNEQMHNSSFRQETCLTDIKDFLHLLHVLCILPKWKCKSKHSNTELQGASLSQAMLWSVQLSVGAVRLWLTEPSSSHCSGFWKVHTTTGGYSEEEHKRICPQTFKDVCMSRQLVLLQFSRLLQTENR